MRTCKTLICLLLVMLSCLAGCRKAGSPPRAKGMGALPGMETRKGDGMKLSSPSWAAGQPIPEKFTCDGKNISPALVWSGVPVQAQSLALVCEDPDAPSGMFVHWIVVNIPADAPGIPENGPLPAGAVAVANDFGTTAYGGPCPPRGVHRYFFRVVALDTVSLPGVARGNYATEFKKHALDSAELMGTYIRK